MTFGRYFHTINSQLVNDFHIAGLELLFRIRGCCVRIQKDEGPGIQDMPV